MKTSPSTAFTAAIAANKPLSWDVTIGGVAIPADRIPANSISLKTGCSESGRFTIGAVVISSFSFSLNNYDHYFDTTNFKGAQVVAFATYDGVEARLKMGTFYVADWRYNNGTIYVECLDKLRELDKSTIALTYPLKLSAILTQALDGTGITKSITPAGATAKVTNGPEYPLTRRQALSYALQLCGCFAFLTPDETLKIGWYHWGTLRTLPDFWSTDFQPQDVNYTGVVARGTTYGSAGMLYSISNNPFLDGENAATIANRILSTIQNKPFLPGTVDTLANPLLEPGDVINIPAQFTGDSAHKFPITSITLRAGLRETLTSDAADSDDADDLRPSEAHEAIRQAIDNGDIGQGGGTVPGVTGIVVVNSSDFDPTDTYAEGTLVLVLDDLLT